MLFKINIRILYNFKFAINYKLMNWNLVLTISKVSLKLIVELRCKSSIENNVFKSNPFKFANRIVITVKFSIFKYVNLFISLISELRLAEFNDLSNISGEDSLKYTLVGAF